MEESMMFGKTIKKIKIFTGSISIMLVLALLVSCAPAQQEAAVVGNIGGNGGGASANLTDVTLADVLAAQSAALPSSEFDWRAHEGTTLRVSLVQHGVSDALVSQIPEFEALTGISVEFSVTPELSYFDQLVPALSSRSGEPDVFMAGAYQLWDYSRAGFVQDLNVFLTNPDNMTSDYDFEDLIGSARDALRWNGIPGNPVGTGAQLGLPMQWELYSLAFNVRAFEENNLEVPRTFDELLYVSERLQGWNGPGSYGIALRGARDWGTIHPGFMSSFANFGAVDFIIEDGRLVSQVNSPAAVEMTEWFVELVHRGGAPDWARYSWYEAGADLGAGMAAILFDADQTGIHQNWPGASQEAGNIAWTTLPVRNVGDTPYSNYWTWSIAMNNYSQNKDAAWLFIKYFTGAEFALHASTVMNSMNPSRYSVWNHPAFLVRMEDHPGYMEAFEATIDSTTILFTPQPYFFETTTEWAATLQDIVAGQFSSVQEGLDQLAATQNRIVQDVVIPN